MEETLEINLKKFEVLIPLYDWADAPSCPAPRQQDDTSNLV